MAETRARGLDVCYSLNEQLYWLLRAILPQGFVYLKARKCSLYGLTVIDAEKTHACALACLYNEHDHWGVVTDLCLKQCDITHGGLHDELN